MFNKSKKQSENTGRQEMVSVHRQEGEDQNLGQNLGSRLGILNGFCLGHLGTAGITEKRKMVMDRMSV